MRLVIVSAFAAWLACVAPVLASPPGLTIVAAETVYGEIARQVAGPGAEVVSVLSNPDQDPHLFEVDPTTARILSRARIVIANGAGYDPWIDTLLGATAAEHRDVIVAARLAGKAQGDNPHVWYDPATVKAVAGALADDLAAADPVHAADYRANAVAFADGLRPLDARIAQMRTRYAGVPVTASEPVFGYMAQALGLDMRNGAFQTAVMNGTEPGPAAVAAFEDDLRTHKVRVLLYNSQADDAAVKRLVDIARQEHVPVVGVSETQPAGKSYAAWMLDQLTALDAALASGRS